LVRLAEVKGVAASIQAKEHGISSWILRPTNNDQTALHQGQGRLTQPIEVLS